MERCSNVIIVKSSLVGRGQPPRRACRFNLLLSFQSSSSSSLSSLYLTITLCNTDSEAVSLLLNPGSYQRHHPQPHQTPPSARSSSRIFPFPGGAPSPLGHQIGDAADIMDDISTGSESDYSNSCV